MENASKALLIAAAVLIVILLIAFGMRIFNSTEDSAQDTEEIAGAMNVQMFNSKFEIYCGRNKSYLDAIATIDLMINSEVLNITTSDWGNRGSKSGLNQMKDIIKENSTFKYEIKILEYDAGGKVSRIGIYKMR